MHYLLYAPVLFLIGTHVLATSFTNDADKWQHLDARLRKYEQKIDNQQVAIDKLQKMNAMQQYSIARLDRLCKVPHINESDSKLKQGLWDPKTKFLDEMINHAQSNNETHIGTLLSGLSVANKDHIDLSRRQAASHIGFFAFLDHSVELGKGQTIVFNRAKTNEGNGYNIHTGTFTCPVSGLYIFSFSVTIRSQHQIWAHLRINSVAMADGVADGYNDGGDMQGGNTGVFKLNAGDVVFVNTFDDLVYHVDVTDGGILNTFTGALLYQL